MALRTRLDAIPETLQEFELAAREKYLEGRNLLLTGNTGGAIYLLGYVAEMLLKNAYFRLTGAAIFDEVEPRLAPARRAGKVSIPAIPDEAYHSLRFWAMMVQQGRIDQGLLPMTFEQEFERRTERLYGNWWVEMRYRRDDSILEDAVEVLDDVGWLMSNYAALWMP